MSTPSGATRQNGMGVASLVLGILGVVGCFGVSFILPLLALIFGILGRKKADAGLADNKGMATAGMILGIIGLVGGVIYIILMIAGAATIPMMSTTTG